jgi:hypothetical protein
MRSSHSRSPIDHQSNSSKSQIFGQLQSLFLIFFCCYITPPKFCSSTWIWIEFSSSMPIYNFTPILHPNSILPLSFLQRSPPHILYSPIYPAIFQNSNFALRTSFLHIFLTVTPNQVILTSEFIELQHVSLQAIYILMIVVFVWLYAWALGEFIFEADEWRLQDQVYEDLKIKYTRTLIFSF